MTPNERKQPADTVPPAPDTPRRFNFYSYQIIALPIFFLIPALALLGILGDTWDTVVIEKEGIVLTVEFPSLARTESFSQLHVSARNESDSVIPAAVLELGRDYLDSMAQATSNPPIEITTGGVYIVELGDIAPGETRAIVLDFLVVDIGTVSGQIRLLSGDNVMLDAAISTFVFP